MVSSQKLKTPFTMILHTLSKQLEYSSSNQRKQQPSLKTQPWAALLKLSAVLSLLGHLKVSLPGRGSPISARQKHNVPKASNLPEQANAEAWPGLLDLDLSRIPLHAQHRIVVREAHVECATATRSYPILGKGMVCDCFAPPLSVKTAW